MIGLDRLIEMNGVIAAGQFSEDGKVIRKVGDIQDGVMEEIAGWCASQNKTASQLVDFLDDNSDYNWRPLNGWAIWGGKYVIAVVGNTGVIVESTRADFNQLIVDLLGSEPTGAKQIY